MSAPWRRYQRWWSGGWLHGPKRWWRWWQRQVRWWTRQLRGSRRSKLVEAIRDTAGASGRIVALITGAVGVEESSADRRLVLVLAVVAGVAWWALVQTVAFVLDRERPGRREARQRRD